MKKTAVIIQPTYLPWIGYFDLIDQSDVFVLFDSVQFVKRSWQQRNRIKTSKGTTWLTVPVYSKGKFEQKISEVLINQTRGFIKDHCQSLYHNYTKAPYFKKYFPQLVSIYEKRHERLSELNLNLISFFMDQLGISTPLLKSSNLAVAGRKSTLLINLCRKLHISQYLSPIGAKAYIHSNHEFKISGIDLRFHDYVHPAYSQLFGGFIPYLSIVDLLFNEGNRSLTIVRSGRKTI